MHKFDIVIVDTGVNISHESLLNSDRIYGFEIREINNCLKVYNAFADEIGHGTAITTIISSLCPYASICVVKIFEKELQINVKKLIYALKFINENIECNLINLSLGTLEYSLELEEICKMLSNQNRILVAAFDNDGALSFPAAFDFVIGVDASNRCMKIDQFIYLSDSYVDILAYGYNHRVAWLENSYLISPGSSFSTAYLTANLYNNLICYKHNISIEKVRTYLKRKYLDKKAIKKSSCIKKEKERMFSIHKAALFPYNKEMHSIVNFADLLPFKIEHIYDVKEHGNINNVIRGIRNNEEYIIESIDEIDWDSIDTLIIGHLLPIKNLKIENIKNYILKECLKNNVNVYCFDDDEIKYWINKFRKKHLYLEYPYFKSHILKNKYGKMYSISAPVLGVFGTSSNQGKFTLQLQLRKHFLDDSFSVGQIGTEPSSLLFEMDEIFSYGYLSNINLSQEKIIEEINALVHNVDCNGKDIIIIGGQSGTIPVYTFNLKFFNLFTMDFLMGSNPDAVILCVNLFDSDEYIRRCIKTISFLEDCKIIALGISPLTINNDWQRAQSLRVVASDNEIKKFKQKIKEQYNLNSYVIGTNEIDDLYLECLNYFTDY